MQTKFKKGDRVRAVNAKPDSRISNGLEGVVIRVNVHNMALNEIAFESGQLLLVYDFEIELITSPRLASEMTLREHYAGLALQGLLAKGSREPYSNGYGKDAVMWADSLIQALNEKP